MPMSESELLTWQSQMSAFRDQARREKKWIWCNYQGLFWTPEELEEAQAAGSFRWGVVNFELRTPEDCIRHLNEAANRARLDWERAFEKVRDWRQRHA